MRLLVQAVLSRYRTTLSLMFASIITGFFAYVGIPKDDNPDVQIPIVILTADHPGASPEDIQRLLGKPLERELRNLEGLANIHVFAIENTITVVLEFSSSVDVDDALIDVRERTDLARAVFPKDTKEPRISAFNTATQPIMRLAVVGNVPERSLAMFALGLKEEIEKVPAVLSAEMKGQRLEMLEIVIDQSQLEAYMLDLPEIARLVSRNNRTIASGLLTTDDGQFPVKVPGLIDTLDELGQLAILRHKDTTVSPHDVADIRRSLSDRKGITTYNGKPAIGIIVSKRIGENILEASASIHAAIAHATSHWPSNVSVSVSYDDSERVADVLADMQTNVLSAILVVVGIVILVLGWKSALLIGVAIPTSILFSFVAMQYLGMTANMMVMIGLIVAVGVLVDGAIIVVEYATRKMKQGLDRRSSFTAAATRMSGPIFTSTATTLAAFLPLLLWPGITGDYMRFLPITLILTLSASFLVAVFFLPTLASHLTHQGGTGGTELLTNPPSPQLGDHPQAGSLYALALTWAIRHPVLIITGSIGFLVLIFSFYGRYGYGTILISSEEPHGAQIIVRGRGNLSVESARALVGDVERDILNVSGVDRLFTYAGPTTSTSPFENLPRDTIGEMYMHVVDWRGRRPVSDIFSDIRSVALRHPGILVEINPYAASIDRDKDVVVELTTPDYSLLGRATSAVRAHMEESMFGLTDIDDTGSLPGVEWNLKVDRVQAKRFGADIAVIGDFVQVATGGLKIGEYRPDDSDYELDIRMRLPTQEQNFSQLDTVGIKTESGLVPISNFVARQPRPRLNILERRNGKWIVRVRANTVSGVLSSDKVNELQDWLLQSDSLLSGVSAQFGGKHRVQSESTNFLAKSLIAALFLMAMILLTQFNSFYHSLLILSAVAMSTAGVLIGLVVTAQPFSVILTGTGIIALAGIVVNNSIVLVDTYQRLRKAGLDSAVAAVHAGSQRLRPILITTTTTIAGLLPLVLQVSVDPFSGEFFYGSPTSYMWKPLSTAIVFGLGFSTILTLIVTPAALVLTSRFGFGK